MNYKRTSMVLLELGFFILATPRCWSEPTAVKTNPKNGVQPKRAKTEPQKSTLAPQAAPHPQPAIPPTVVTDDITLDGPKSLVVKERGQLTVEAGTWAGRLAYAFKELGRGPYPSFLVLGSLASKEGDNATVASAPQMFEVKNKLTKSLATVYEPQFSPDGHYVLFKLGLYTGSHPEFQLYVLDTQTQDLKRIVDPEMILNYESVSWSPDGNYIAFVSGGDAWGNAIYDENYVLPLNLWVVNWRTGTLYSVASNDTVRGPFNWRGAHTLVFGMLPPEGQQAIRDREHAAPGHHGDAPVVSPNVYEYSIENGTPHLSIADGYRPLPSPDGQWVAFFGSEDPKKPIPLSQGWQDNPQGMALSVAHSDGSERKALDVESELCPSLRWLPDNQHLLTLRPTSFTKDGETDAELREWDIKTGKFRSVAVLKAQDFKLGFHTIYELQFNILEVSQDESTAIVSVSEVTGQVPNTAILTSKLSLKAVNLKTGVVSPVLSVTNPSGLDFQLNSSK